jgi:hypothetical protein
MEVYKKLEEVLERYATEEDVAVLAGYVMSLQMQIHDINKSLDEIFEILLILGDNKYPRRSNG